MSLKLRAIIHCDADGCGKTAEIAVSPWAGFGGPSSIEVKRQLPDWSIPPIGARLDTHMFCPEHK